MIQFLDTIPATLPWFSIVLAGILGMFTLYAGIALVVALFHPRAHIRRIAAHAFEQLLDVTFFRRRR